MTRAFAPAEGSRSGSVRFKQGMRALPGGVTVIGAYGPDGALEAITATAVTSLSAEPPSLLVCVGRRASIAAALAAKAWFSVNVLAAEQVDVAKAFGGQLDARGADRFRYGTWHRAVGADVPLLTGCRVSFECQVAHVHDWATHHVVIGTVREVHVSHTAGASLVYADGKYHPVG